MNRNAHIRGTAKPAGSGVWGLYGPGIHPRPRPSRPPQRPYMMRPVDTTRRPMSSELARFGKDNEFTLHLAVTGDQRLACWRLVYEQYLASGYAEPQAQPLRYTLHDAVPNTGTFLIQCGGKLAGTISVFPDSSMGLPADAIYKRDLDALRDAGRTPAEIGRFTVAPRFAGDRKVAMQMIEIPCLYARQVLSATDVVITVNPAHQSFYRRMMLFETQGGEKSMDSVCGAPALLMRMDLAYQEALIRSAHGEEAWPDGDAPRPTVYRHFRSHAAEMALAARIRQAQRPLPPDFLRRYFGNDPSPAAAPRTSSTAPFEERLPVRRFRTA